MDIEFFPEWIVVTLSVSSVIIGIIIQIAFAVAVLEDADNLPNSRRTIFVGPVIWFLATLLGGVFTATLYWLMHHSMLSSSVAFSGSSENNREEDKATSGEQIKQSEQAVTYKTCLNCLTENRTDATKCESCGNDLRSISQ